MLNRKQQLKKYIRILTEKANTANYLSPSMEKQLVKYAWELAALEGEK